MVNGTLHARIGSTGEGVGACRHARMRRKAGEFLRYRDLSDARGLRMCGSQRILGAHSILLEGTQGFGLSLIHGDWPNVTSHDTTAAQLLADAGVPPTRLDRVVLVARTMPIRVAGNSGPLHGETSWDDLSSRLGRPVLERTTVTKKVRRIGEWDQDLVDEAVRVNGATEIALTFLDYLSPEDANKRTFASLSPRSRNFITNLEDRHAIPVTMMGTGYDEKTGWVCIEKGRN